MIEHIGEARRRQNQLGFTLIELLVVIVILGVLSAVVVFAVRGTGDKGKSSAVTIDERTIKTAEEGYCAKYGAYADGAELVQKGFLSDLPQYHAVFAEQGGGSCNGWRFSILRTAEGGPSAPGTWDATTPPPSNMQPIFAVRMADGRVLVGGFDNSDDSPMTAIWDPTTTPTTWTPVDPHPEPVRSYMLDSALLLADDPATAANECADANAGVNNCGKVLFRESFLFDPTKAGLPGQQQWETLPTPATCYVCGTPRNYARTPRNMVQIKGTPATCGPLCGQIFIAGAVTSSPNPPGALLYNPANNAYTEMTYPNPPGTNDTIPYSSYVTRLTDGRIFFCCVADGTFAPGSWFFSPVTSAWSPGPAPSALYFRETGWGVSGDVAAGGSGTGPTPVLANGDLLFTDPFSTPGDTGLYAPEAGQAGSWRSPAPGCPTEDRCNVFGSLLDGRVLARGGRLSTTTYTFNPASSAWERAGDMIPSDNPVGVGPAVLLDPSAGPCGDNCGKMFVPALGVAQLYSA